MSIRAIARDLYRAQQNIDKIEKALKEVSHAEQDALRHELRQASNEYELIRKMLNGEKESSSFRKKFQ